VVTFKATTTMSGFEMKSMTSEAGKVAFKTCCAKTMTGVRYRDVNIISITGTSRRELKSLDNRVDLNSSSSSSKGEGNDLKRLESRRLAIASINWNVSVALTRLGTTSGSSAYESMTSELSTAMANGTFEAAMKSQSTLFSNINSASVALDNDYKVVTEITPTAAPTSAPTVTAIIPSVSQMIISNLTRTSLTLSVTLIKTRIVEGDISSGFLFCVAILNGSTPSSIGSVKAPVSDLASTKNMVQTFPIGSIFPLTSSVTFTELVALQTYAMYCYVETSLGTGSLFSEVLETRTVTTTGCCKTLTFINSPVFIFGNVEKYTVKSTKSTYIFTYLLSSAPLKSLQVVPVFKLNGVISTAITATPSFSTFTSKSQLTGQFFLKAGSKISGSYTISLTASGPSKVQYTGASTSVQILSSFSKVPAPIITSSQFSDSGQAVVITFDSLTDQAGIIATSWSCDLLFTFTSASKTTCSWVNTSAVSASFGVVTSVANNIVYLSTGGSVTLNNGLLKAFCTGTVSACATNPVASIMSVITLAPHNPSTPTGLSF
jgi:hypothetical protein